MAQEATHDSIYKNDSLSSKEKLEMQTFMFPLIEHLTDIEMYERKLDATVDEEKKKDIEQKILSLKQTIKEHKECNKDYISENISLIDSVFKEYVARKSIEKLKKSVDLELTSEQAEELIHIYRNAINYLSTYQKDETLTDTGVTGFKNIDSLLAQIDNKTFNEVFDLSKNSEHQYKNFSLDSLLNVSKKSVNLSNITTILNELKEHVSSIKEKHDSEKNI